MMHTSLNVAMTSTPDCLSTDVCTRRLSIHHLLTAPSLLLFEFDLYVAFHIIPTCIYSMHREFKRFSNLSILLSTEAVIFASCTIKYGIFNHLADLKVG